ncbi:MAG TPA: hypothetical protein VIW24_01940 [Aldersonia sp.]
MLAGVVQSSCSLGCELPCLMLGGALGLNGRGGFIERKVTEFGGLAASKCTALNCTDTGFIGDGVLEELPSGSMLGATRVGRVDLNKARIRDALSTALALAPALHWAHWTCSAREIVAVRGLAGERSAGRDGARPIPLRPSDSTDRRDDEHPSRISLPRTPT